MQQRSHRAMAGMLAAAMLLGGCYGPFELTKKVHKWNGEVSENKWVVEVVFLIASWLPVYGIATLADAIIFNSVEFWTGENPLSKASAGSPSATKRIVRGDQEVVLKHVATEQGDALVIEQSIKGQLAHSLRIQREGGQTVALDGQGRVVFTAQTQADGGLVIANAKGDAMAHYSREQAKQIIDSALQ